MHEVVLAHPADIDGWRSAARSLDRGGVPAEAVTWRIEGEAGDLFAGAPLPAPAAPPRVVPKSFVSLTGDMLLHRDRERFALAYRLLRRLATEPRLMEVAADADVARAREMAKSVRRDIHKMTAFVRFRAVAGPEGEVFVSWFEPDHHILARTAPFFMRRFAGMRWSILTPEASAHWDGETLTHGAGAAKSDAPDGDALEEVWRTYFASIFNPARLKVKAMTAEMPKKYWKNLPEAELIAPLIREARARERRMLAAPATLPGRASPVRHEEMPMPETAGTLEDLARAVGACSRCPLHGPATQAVPGEGPAAARVMFVGEQPGDREDLAGRPFVGPAGQLFDTALGRVGIDRGGVFLTNAVKHFKFAPRGKRRIHQSPNASEIEHCRWWLAEERRLVRPGLIVAMGATAARAVTGRPVKIGEARGRVRDGEDAETLVTVHPSYLLRLRDPGRKREEWDRFLGDLALARDWLAADGGGAQA